MKKLSCLYAILLMVSIAAKAAGPYQPGDHASDFSLKNVDGKIISLTQFTDAKGYIVMFICNTCPIVKHYESRITDLHKKYAAKGYPVIAINSNDKIISPGDSFEEMQKLAAEKKFEFNYLYDGTQEVVNKYGATNKPNVYILSKKDGNHKVEYTGAIDNNVENPDLADKKYVEDAVNALLKGEEVTVTRTRAVGCTVKLKKT